MRGAMRGMSLTLTQTVKSTDGETSREPMNAQKAHAEPLKWPRQATEDANGVRWS
jgi:hypothetical protein